MDRIKSKINTNNKQFKENYQAMLELVGELDLKLVEARDQGKPARIERARKNNQFLASERLELLLDRDSPFLELMPLAGLGLENGLGPNGTTITGMGFISGRLCMITSNIGTKKGGTMDYATSQKHCLLYTSPSPRDATLSRMPSSA